MSRWCSTAGTDSSWGLGLPTAYAWRVSRFWSLTLRLFYWVITRLQPLVRPWAERVGLGNVVEVIVAGRRTGRRRVSCSASCESTTGGISATRTGRSTGRGTWTPPVAQPWCSHTSRPSRSGPSSCRSARSGAESSQRRGTNTSSRAMSSTGLPGGTSSPSAAITGSSRYGRPPDLLPAVEWPAWAGGAAVRRRL